jgi:hypothetical protein
VASGVQRSRRWVGHKPGVIGNIANRAEKSFRRESREAIRAIMRGDLDAQDRVPARPRDIAYDIA